jgi:tRNA(His) guanylyltransferase
MDNFGDRMKEFEMAEAGRKFMKGLPIVCRWDGKGFSKFTKGLRRPYDERLHNLMIATTKHIVKEMNAVVAYTQSDEISAILYCEDYNDEIMYNGRIQKLTSIGASLATAYFNKHLADFIPEKKDELPIFDLRVWNVPSKSEAANAIVWREMDATKNAISMASRHYYSHHQLMNKNGKEMQEMLFQKGVNFNDYPDFFKRGSYVKKITYSKILSAFEINKLPPKHNARNNNNTIIRHKIEVLNLPPMGKVLNKVEVLFDGVSPLLQTN